MRLPEDSKVQGRSNANRKIKIYQLEKKAEKMAKELKEKRIICRKAEKDIKKHKLREGCLQHGFEEEHRQNKHLVSAEEELEGRISRIDCDILFSLHELQ